MNACETDGPPAVQLRSSRAVLGVFFVWMLLVAAVVRPLHASLPEPGVTVYGVVLDDFGRKQTQGRITLTFVPTNGTTVELPVDLADINGQFSYALTIPSELAISGRPLTRGRMTFRTTPATWRTAPRPLGGTNLNVMTAGGGSNLVVSIQSRGTFRRLDVTTGFDSDANGLIDAWERFFFGRIGIDPNASAADDGISNLTKMYLGLDPRAPAGGTLRFTAVQVLANGACQVEWGSEAGRLYNLTRSATLNGTFAPIGTNLPATPPVNRFTDTGAATNALFFYRVQRLP
jgi:hypothetical protein